jgi:DNA replication protein
MKNKNFVIDASFLKVGELENLSVGEFSLLVYFDNAYDNTFDIDVIKRVLNLDEQNILMYVNNLTNKKLIEIKTEKNDSNKSIEKIYIDKFYNKVTEHNLVEVKKRKDSDIYTKFEEEFGRTLSPMDYEVINAWLEKEFSEDLIIHALKEASYNGVKNLRYIDKILFEWNKQGFKKISDISKKKEDTVMYEEDVLNYNWLDDNE